MPDAFAALKRAPLAILNLLLWPARACWRGRRRLLIALAVLVALHLIATLITGLMLQRELNRLRKAGEPMTAAELLTPLQLEPETSVSPDSPNAAWVYQHAFQTLRLTKDEQQEYTDLPSPTSTETAAGEPITPAQVAAARLAFARKVIPKNAHYFSLLEEASRIHDCAFTIRWDAGWNALFPNFAPMREAGRWLSLRAELLTSEGRVDNALADADTTLRIAEHAKTEPTLIGQLVGYALQSIAVRSLESTLSAGQPSPTACRASYDQLAAIDQINPSVRALQCERVLMGMWAYDSLRRHPIEASRNLFDITGQSGGWRWLVLCTYTTLGRPFFNLDAATYLRHMRDQTAAFEQPWPQSFRAVNALAKELEQVPVYRGVLTHMVLPVFSRALESRESRTALLRAAQIALALKVYQAEHGAYPDFLADLQDAGWKLPTDPFTQKPYHYRRDGAGFLVWSAGPDMDDDNGRDVDPKRAPARFVGEDYDLTFRCAG